MKKIRIGVIGAGAISEFHLASYAKNPEVEICAICDVNEQTAKARAEQFGIPQYYTSHKEILQDASIDAVSIVTPTFTHKDLVIQALKSGKHVLCEKPPAMNGEEAAECEKVALETGKILMYAFVLRFSKETRFLKDYIDAGKMGEIYYAEATRLERCTNLGGWFVNKEQSGGGVLIDGVIHEIDSVLYLMGYPKVKSVKGTINNKMDYLLNQMKGVGNGWVSSDVSKYDRNVESMASGYVTFENGACLYIKASWALNTVKEGRSFELCGTKAGADFSSNELKLFSVEDYGYYLESTPVLRDNIDVFDEEINHFVDCCAGRGKCICTPQQGTMIMQIINAIYESAKTGKEVIF